MKKAKKKIKKFAPRTADVKEWIRRLEEAHGDAKQALEFSSPLELLVALILAAQCTDERVNQVTKPLFRKYRDAEAYAGAEQETLEEEVRSTGFYRNKAKAIRTACREIVDRFGGNVPEGVEDLLRLPGVGRKTANIVIGNAFGRPAIGVDTHVKRLALRLGFRSCVFSGNPLLLLPLARGLRSDPLCIGLDACRQFGGLGGLGRCPLCGFLRAYGNSSSSDGGVVIRKLGIASGS